MQKNVWFFSFSLILALKCSNAVAATAPGLVGTRASGPDDPAAGQYMTYEAQYRKLILGGFDSRLRAREGLTVLFKINRNGTLSNVTLFGTSGSPTFDLAAIETVVTAAPMPIPPQGKTTDYFDGLPGRIDFVPSANVSTSRKETKLPIEPFVHKIPLNVISRYPGVFSKSDLISWKNQRLIRKSYAPQLLYRQGSSDEAAINQVLKNEIYNYFSDWARFFSTHRSADKAELEAVKARLLAKYKILWKN